MTRLPKNIEVPKMTSAISTDKLASQLATLGLARNDCVMVHASLRKLGPVEDGANGVIKAVLEVIGTGGTMVMLLGSRQGDTFNPKSSCADPDNGVLPEMFRQFPGTKVNNHPAARTCAFGANAEHLLEPIPLHDYYSEGSPIERFILGNGKVLRLGPDIDTMTITHWAEYQAKVSPKKRVTRSYLTEKDGEVLIDSLDDSKGIQEWNAGDYFGQIFIDYKASGKAITGQVGECEAELIDSQDYCEFAIRWMESNFSREQTGERCK
jgi:aminoglycoside N3'-acetyltransferase